MSLDRTILYDLCDYLMQQRAFCEIDCNELYKCLANTHSWQQFANDLHNKYDQKHIIIWSEQTGLTLPFKNYLGILPKTLILSKSLEKKPIVLKSVEIHNIFGKIVSN